MKKPISKKLLLHPLYILSLILLISNDWVFKEMFHNFWTGKLSDFAGLFIFPIFFSVLMPNRIKAVHIITALGFIFWKTPLSQPLLDFVYWQGFVIERVIDYTDLVALIAILSSFLFIQYWHTHKNYSIVIPRVRLTYLVLFISFFAFCATSPVRPIMMMGDYNLEKDIDSKLTQKEIIEKLEAEGYHLEKGIATHSWDESNRNQYPPARNNKLEIDTSESARNAWYITNVSVKEDTLQALNIYIAENYNQTETRVKLLGICIDSTKFLTNKEVNQYDRYLKRKILRKLKR